MFDAIVRYAPTKTSLNVPHRAWRFLDEKEVVRIRRFENRSAAHQQSRNGDVQDTLSNGASNESIDLVRAEMDVYLAQMALQTERSISRWATVKQVVLWIMLSYAIIFYIAMSALNAWMRVV